MQSLLVILALFAGAVLADKPLVYKYQDSSENHYPLTSSEYLKMVFGGKFGMVDIDMTVTSAADSVLNLLPFLGLHEADKIAKRIDLKKMLKESALPFVTMFVPTNEAIRMWKEQIPAEMAEDTDVLTTLAKAWVVPNMAVRSTGFLNEKKLPTLATDVKLRVNVYDDVNKVTINGAPIRLRDYSIGDNVVHTIDKMIFPLPDVNVVDMLARVDDFSMLFNLIKKAGLQDVLANTDALTVLAPVNKAFDLVPADVMADLAANMTKLQRLLKYHVVPRTYYSAGIPSGKTMDTIVGEKITIDIEDGKFVINRKPEQPTKAAKILYPDIPVFNGVVQVIDKVLDMPPKSWHV